MNQKLSFSLLQPAGEYEYRVLPDYVLHDLGLDGFLQEVSNDAKQRRMIANILSKISPSPFRSRHPFRYLLRHPLPHRSISQHLHRRPHLHPHLLRLLHRHLSRDLLLRMMHLSTSPA